MSGETQLRRDRKYKFAWASFLALLVLTFWDKLNGDQFVTGLGLVIGAYMVGNVGEHYAKAKKQEEC